MYELWGQHGAVGAAHVLTSAMVGSVRSAVGELLERHKELSEEGVADPEHCNSEGLVSPLPFGSCTALV